MARFGSPSESTLPWSRAILAALWGLSSWGRAPLSLLGERIVLALCRTCMRHGILIGVFPSAGADHLLRKVDDALEMISRFDPQRFRRLRSDMARILVIRAKHPFFSPYTRVCYLDEATVRDWSVGDVALALVHEAIHGRLRRRGLTAFGPTFVKRVEELCIDEEIAFAKRWPKDEVPLRDGYIEYLSNVRRTYPATQEWPRRRSQARRDGGV